MRTAVSIKQNYIGGRWIDASAAVKNINPSDVSDVIGLYAEADAAQTEVAIAAARVAFRSWSQSNPQERFNLLDRVGTVLLARKHELGRLLSREEGKILSEGIAEAGAPAGVFNLVMGKGSVVGETLVSSPEVDAISFTGSVGTGRAIAERAVSLGKKVQLEMGGKNPLVVLDDADLRIAVDAALNGAYFSTGQRCTASSRLIVTSEIHDRFLDALSERLANLVVDDALKEGTQMGPVVDQSQLEQDLRYISIGYKEGALLVSGGKQLKRERDGFYLEPALFAEATNAMSICREEIFGPVAAIIRVKDYEEALATANDTPFGLCAGICTTSLKFATHFKRNAAVGMVMVNLPTAGVDYHVPFGGRKGSSCGPREQGSYATEFFTTVKTSYTAS